MANPHMARKGPFIADETPRKVLWCACGLSKKQPYCDGAHRDSEIRPIIVDITGAKKVVWCGCKQSGNKPYCDGTHGRL